MDLKKLEKISRQLLLEQVIDIEVREKLIEIFRKAKTLEYGKSVIAHELSIIAKELLSKDLNKNLKIEVAVDYNVDIFLTLIRKRKTDYFIFVPYGTIRKGLEPEESAAAFLYELGYIYTDVKYGLYFYWFMLDKSIRIGAYIPIVSFLVKIYKEFAKRKGLQDIDKNNIVFKAAIAVVIIVNFLLYTYGLAMKSYFITNNKTLYYNVRMGLVNELFGYYRKYKEKIHEPYLTDSSYLNKLFNKIFEASKKIFLPMYDHSLPSFNPDKLLTDFIDYVTSEIILKKSQLNDKEKKIIISQINSLKDMVDKNIDEDKIEQLFDIITNTMVKKG